MATNKNRMNDLIKWADQALQEQSKQHAPGCSKVLIKSEDPKSNNTINESYNGSVAALGVSIAMSELLPTLAIYYQDKPNSTAKPKANRRSVLDVIARIISMDTEYSKDFSAGNKYPENLFDHALEQGNDSALKQEVIECSIALKHVVRTYKLVKNEQST